MTDEEAAQLLSGSILSMSGTLDGKLRDAIIKALDALREKVGKKKEADGKLCSQGGNTHLVVGLMYPGNKIPVGVALSCYSCGATLPSQLS